jgi:ATP-dependent Clp protease, protease subunit
MPVLTEPPRAFFDGVEYKIAEDRRLYLTGIITATTYHEIAIRLRYLSLVNQKPITLCLNTPGGSLTDALGLYDVIRATSKSVPVDIVTVGSCMSAGVLLLQAGTRRLSYPATQFLIHELSACGGGKLSQMTDEAQFARHLQEVADTIVAGRAGISVAEFQALYQRRDYFLSAKEAKRLHLIDQIVRL